MTVLRN